MPFSTLGPKYRKTEFKIVHIELKEWWRREGKQWVLGSEHTEGGKVGANRGGGGKTKLSLPQGSSLCCSSLPLLFLFKRKSATLPIRTSWVHWFFRLKEEDALVAPARAVTRIHLGVGWDDRFFSLMPPYSCNRLVRPFLRWVQGP